MTGDEIIEMLEKYPVYNIRKSDGKYIVFINDDPKTAVIAATLEDAACQSDMIAADP